MKSGEKYPKILFNLWIPILVLLVSSCESGGTDNITPAENSDFPSFITPVDQYFSVHIGKIPEIEGDTFKLEISGTTTGTHTFSLEQLRNLKMVEKTVTVECIGNPANGDLLGTATWKGFLLFDLLDSLGIKPGTTTVKYTCADGYYTYNSLEQLQSREVLAALYMNGEVLPAMYGFPLRIVFPGYYGVRQPCWITKMELFEAGILDYWTRQGWDTDSAMAIDSKIFFPSDHFALTLGESVKIGGAAYGSRRIYSVEWTVDGGATWFPSVIHQQMDLDYVWVFWEANFTSPEAKNYIIRSRATGVDGSVQPQVDNKYLDGTNSWPLINISVKDN